MKTEPSDSMCNAVDMSRVLFSPIRAIVSSYKDDMLTRVVNKQENLLGISSIVGYFVAMKHADGIVRLTHSVCHPNDYCRYSKELGKCIAKDRQYKIDPNLMKEVKITNEHGTSIMHVQKLRQANTPVNYGNDVCYMFMGTLKVQQNRMIDRCVRYFKDMKYLTSV